MYNSPIRSVGRMVKRNPQNVAQPIATPAPLDIFSMYRIIELVQELEKMKETMLEAIATAQEATKKAQEIQQGVPGNPGPRGYSIKGDKGDQGSPADPEKVAQLLLPKVLPHITAPKGDKGDDADTEEVAAIAAALVLDKIKKPEDVDVEGMMSAIVARITEGKMLKMEHVSGLEQTIRAQWNQLHSRGGYLHGSGITSLLAGSGVTVTKNANGSYTISTSGSGFTKLTATETPDANNTVFTFSSASAKPSYIVSDGVWYEATSESGVVFWTWNSGTKKATMGIPPTTSIFAVV